MTDLNSKCSDVDTDQKLLRVKLSKKRKMVLGFPILKMYRTPLHLELRFVTCNGAEENQAHRCDPYDLRVQEQPLFLVCSSINIFTSVGLDP